MNMSIQESLKNIGMNQKETTIYLTILSKGQQTQQEISEHTGILRQTVYEIMPTLETKGFINHTMKGKRKIYSAVSPEILFEQLQSKVNDFEAVMQELKQLQTESESSSITFIGIQGLKNMFAQSLESKTDICWLINKQMADKMFKDYYWHNYAQKRIEKKIPIKLLIEPTKDADWNTDKSVLRATRRHSVISK
jgi:sugar-specific transcriptional regulator TrmB